MTSKQPNTTFATFPPNYSLIGIALICAVTFLFCFPKGFTITDEVSYFKQALAYSQGSTSLDTYNHIRNMQGEQLAGDYPPGTSLMLIPWLVLFGKKSIFISGLLYLLLSLFFLQKTLRALALPAIFALLLFTYPPTLLLCRSIMSGMPSLLISCLFFYFYYRPKEKHGHPFVLGLLAGISLLFRETNILIFGFFILDYAIKDRKGWGMIFSGFMLSICIRFISATLIFGDPLFLKDHEPTFLLSHLVRNLPLYLFALSVYLPFGLIGTFFYKGKAKWALKATVLFNLLFYSLYEYSGMINSGLKSLILGPRYFLPLLPILIIAVAQWVNQLSQRNFLRRFFKSIFYPIITALFVVFTLVGANYLFSQHDKISESILSKDTSKVHVLNLQDCYKYMNEFHGAANTKNVDALDEPKFAKELIAKDGHFYFSIFKRQDTPVIKKGYERFGAYFEQLKASYNLEQVESINTLDKLSFETWKVSAR